MSLPTYNGVAPRITADEIDQYRGRYVTLWVSANSAGNPQACTCLLTKKPPEIHQSQSAFATNTEAVCFVDNNSGRLFYHSIGHLDDEVDEKGLAALVQHSKQYPALFGM